MPPVMQSTVSPRQLDARSLLGMSLQQPAETEERSNYALQVAGWVVGRNAPVSRVELVDNGQVIKLAPVDVNRPDVASHFLQATWAVRSGFFTMVNTLALEPTFELELRAVLDKQATVPLAVIRGQRQPLPGADADKLQPLMITSLGRTGTTWLMRLLAEHPAIVAYRRYPYEVRPAMYWAHMLRVLSAPADYAKPTSHPHGFHLDASVVGPNPFFEATLHEYPDLQDWAGHDYAKELATFCQNSIEAWYRRLALNQEQPRAAYFAEKYLPRKSQGLLWELYPRAREVFLVRDFRDIASSVLAFNAQRGFDDFGRQHAATDEEYLHKLRLAGTVLLENWRRRAARSHLIRYEELITSPQDTLGSL
ncbi:MAG: sulfotransferase, partial [Chloroflexota bacterium]|nr:sulfotransferase [Chloroflexota bacterium]